MNRYRKDLEPIDKELGIVIFAQKLSRSSQRYEIRKKTIPDPWVEKAKDSGSATLVKALLVGRFILVKRIESWLVNFFYCTKKTTYLFVCFEQCCGTVTIYYGSGSGSGSGSDF